MVPFCSNAIRAVGKCWQLAVAATASPLTTSRSRLDVDLGSPPARSLPPSVARFGARPTSETNQCRRAQASAASGLTALCASLPICPSQRRRKFGSKDAAEGNVQGVLLTYGCPVNASLNRGQLEVKGWSNNGFVLRLDTVCPSHALPPPYPSIDSVLPMI